RASGSGRSLRRPRPARPSGARLSSPRPGGHRRRGPDRRRPSIRGSGSAQPGTLPPTGGGAAALDCGTTPVVRNGTVGAGPAGAGLGGWPSPARRRAGAGGPARRPGRGASVPSHGTSVCNTDSGRPRGRWVHPAVPGPTGDRGLCNRSNPIGGVMVLDTTHSGTVVIRRAAKPVRNPVRPEAMHGEPTRHDPDSIAITSDNGGGAPSVRDADVDLLIAFLNTVDVEDGS